MQDALEPAIGAEEKDASCATGLGHDDIMGRVDGNGGRRLERSTAVQLGGADGRLDVAVVGHHRYLTARRRFQHHQVLSSNSELLQRRTVTHRLEL